MRNFENVPRVDFFEISLKVTLFIKEIPMHFYRGSHEYFKRISLIKLMLKGFLNIKLKTISNFGPISL